MRIQAHDGHQILHQMWLEGGLKKLSSLSLLVANGCPVRSSQKAASASRPCSPLIVEGRSIVPATLALVEAEVARCAEGYSLC